jgi:hypothetical protein
LVGISQSDGSRGRDEHDGGRGQPFRQGIGIEGRIRRLFRQGDVTRVLDEFLKLGVGDRGSIHPEAVHTDGMGRCFFGVMAV